jgi:hypothetical protein
VRETLTDSARSFGYHLLRYVRLLVSSEPCDSSVIVPYCCGLQYVCAFYFIWAPFSSDIFFPSLVLRFSSNFSRYISGKFVVHFRFVLLVLVNFLIRSEKNLAISLEICANMLL